MSITEKIVDKFFDPEINHLDYEELLELIESNHGYLVKMAFIIEDLLSQNYNGGIYQWHDNGYSFSCQMLKDFIEEKCDDSPAKYNFLCFITDFIEQYEWVEDGLKLIKRMEFSYRDFFTEKLEEDFMSYCNRIEKRFNPEEFHDLCEKYFSENYDGSKASIN